MTIAIHQPNYIPWIGYFYKIAASDVFVFLDHVKIPDRSVANRNYILGKNGEKVLLTVPLSRNEINYNKCSPDYSKNWQIKHLNCIKDAYQKSPFFDEIFPAFSELLKLKHKTLSELNIQLINHFCSLLNINSKRIKSSEMNLSSELKKNFLNLEICKKLKADTYLSGKGGMNYNDESSYSNLGITIKYTEFTNPQYRQISSATFLSSLSILDLLFNTGIEDSRSYFNSLNSDRN